LIQENTTMSQEQQPEALRLAAICETKGMFPVADELNRMHARILELEQGKCLHQIAEPSAQSPEDAQIQALMRKHRIWIEHSTLFENDEPERELRAVQAEEHQFNAFVQDLIAVTQLAAAPQAVQAAVPRGTKFFSFDPCDDLVVHGTEEAARAAAQQSIDLYREDAADGWPEEVERVCWGIVLGQAAETKLSGDLPSDAFAMGVSGSLPSVDFELQSPAHPAEGVPAAIDPNECGQDVFNNGVSVGLFDIPKDTANAICVGISEATGVRLDWHYIAGRVHIKVLVVPQPAAQGMDAQQYRIIDHGELIQAGDEFLRDDFTWQIDPEGIFVGTRYGIALRPARRAIAAQAKQGGA
jgi:hypothetical protein